MYTTIVIVGIVAIALVVLAGKVVRWALKKEEKPAEPIPTDPAAKAAAEAKAKAEADALAKKAADKEKGLLATCWRTIKWLAKMAARLLLIGVVLYGIYYAIDKHKWSNGKTLVQASIASSPASAPPPEVWRYSEQEAATGKLVWKTDGVRILERVRGQEPRFMFTVPSPYEGITSHSRYEWDHRLPEGIVENRERNMRGKFVGDFISDTQFTGSFMVNGGVYTFRLERIQ